MQSRGVRPLLDELATIDGAADAAALAAVLGQLQRTGVGGGTGVRRHRFEGFDPLSGAPDAVRHQAADESYYRDPQHAEILAAYPGHIARMFALVYGGSADDHAQTAERIVALETQLAAARWDVVKRRDADLTYNLRAFAELAPGARLRLGRLDRRARGLPQTAPELVVRQPDYLTAFAALWSTADLDDWKRWARWRLIHSARRCSPMRLSQKTSRSTADCCPVPRRSGSGGSGVALVENLMGDALGKLYVSGTFRRAQGADGRVGGQPARGLPGVDHQPRLDDTGDPRQGAGQTGQVHPKIGYPKRWRDYSKLVVRRDDLYGNYQRGHALESDRELGKLGGPVDRDEVVHDTADRERLLQPRHERDRVPRGDPAAAVLRRRAPTTRPTTAVSARSSVTRSGTASTIRAPSTTATKPGRLVDRRRPNRIRLPHKDGSSSSTTTSCHGHWTVPTT